MKNYLQTLIFLCGITATATCVAMRPYLFEEIDTDHNGAISMEEAAMRDDLKQHFAEIDKDKSGDLSVDEYSSYENAGMMPEDVEIPEPGAAPVM